MGLILRVSIKKKQSIEFKHTDPPVKKRFQLQWPLKEAMLLGRLISFKKVKLQTVLPFANSLGYILPYLFNNSHFYLSIYLSIYLFQSVHYLSIYLSIYPLIYDTS